MPKIKSFFYSTILFLLLSISFTTEASVQNSISGEIKNLSKGELKLILEEDINRKKSRIITEIPVDKNGRFRFEKDLPPHIYSLQVNDKKLSRSPSEKIKTSSSRATPPVNVNCR